MTDNVSNNAGAYLRTQVLTASPEKLRLMLLDGAVRFARQGREGLERKDYSASFDGFSKTRDILVELINSMRVEVDPDLCARVQSLYTFIYQTVVSASLEKDIAKADKAIEMLEYERDTWAMAIERLAAAKTPGAGPAVIPDPGQRRPLCISG